MSSPFKSAEKPGRRVFAARLLAWYDENGRHELPWKRKPNLYRTWVAEIMLQQTRVETVVPYYERFIAVFSDVSVLASASLDDVLRYWSGLGYYARARNMHRAARNIAVEHEGEFPQTLEEILKLPGIGRSTAGAILAQSLGLRHPILDGNVKRVLCRYHAIEGYPGRSEVKKTLWDWAERLTPDRRVADYTQAIMDLGATLCSRRNPRCDLCPQAINCQALALDAVGRYPTTRSKVHRPQRYATFFILRNAAGEVFLQRRPPTGIWGGLWSFPECGFENPSQEEVAKWCRKQFGITVSMERVLPGIRHGFTHFELQITPVLVKAGELGDRIMESGQQVWYNLQEEPPGGLAAPVKSLLQKIGSNNLE